MRGFTQKLALVCAAVWLPVTVGAQTNPQLYSVQAIDNMCTEAQKIISNTSLEAYAIRHNNLDSFLFSSSAPYEGPNLSAYNGKETPGDTLPLTVQQFNYFNMNPRTGWVYPETVSCKMKDAEAIQFHFGPTAAGAQSTCRAINEQTFADVFASLTSWQRRTLVYDENDIVFDDDVPKPSGPQWANPLASPFAPKTIYFGGDGLVHVQSIASIVARTNPTNLAGPDKKGSYYCHLPTPEHILAVLRGQVFPCDNIPGDFCFRL